MRAPLVTSGRIWAATGVLVAGVVAVVLAMQPHGSTTDSSNTGAQSAAASPAAAAPAAAAPAPSFDLLCPAPRAFGDVSSVRVQLGYKETGAGAFYMTVDFGDGSTDGGDYQDSKTFLSHTYHQPGSYQVLATALPYSGQPQQLRSSCVVSWSAAAAPDVTTAVPPILSSPNTEAPAVGGGYPVTCSDGTLSNAGGKQGACSHHGGVG